MTLTSGDSGIATTPTSREPVFSTGMPAIDASADNTVGTATAARPDTFNPSGTNPPTAPVDVGSA